jgi:hypothetical protein
VSRASKVICSPCTSRRFAARRSSPSSFRVCSTRGQGPAPMLATGRGQGYGSARRSLSIGVTSNSRPRTLTVRAVKTDARTGCRVDLSGGLRGELAEHQARSRGRPSDPVFVNRSGRRQATRNVESRSRLRSVRRTSGSPKVGIRSPGRAGHAAPLRRTDATLRFARRSQTTSPHQLGHKKTTFSMDYAQGG